MSEASGPSNESKNKNLTEADKERFLKEFVLITKTDSKAADFFLNQHDWDIQRAIPDYFDLATEISHDKPEEFSGHKNQAWAREVANNPKVAGAFSLITWNVDGLDERNLLARTHNLISILREEKPDVIFLQEVVPMSLLNITQAFKNEYKIHSPDDLDAGYFVTTLLRNDTVQVLNQSEYEFPNTAMGRGILSTEVNIGGMKLWLHNTHLESTAEFKKARIDQLKIIFNKLRENISTHSTIAGGDLNLRDPEVGDAGGIPKNCVDIWEASGRREECRFTWDTARNTNCLSKGGGGPKGNFKPRIRFDRVYMSTTTGSKIPYPSPKHFKLIGVEKVPHTQSYTSDHWGIQIYFTINK